LDAELHYNEQNRGWRTRVPEQSSNVKRETSNNGKPFVDVSSFQRFLSAAYVVQQHNDRIRGEQPVAEYSTALSQFAEIEEEIRKRGLDLQTAARMIAQPAQQVAHADGVAIAILEKDQLVYYAAVGSATAEAETRVAQSGSVCAECLQSGELLECPDAERDLRLPAGFCRDHGIKALLAAPAKLQGKIVGVIELRFSTRQTFRQEDSRNCQLMADLLAGVVEYARNLPPRATASSEHEEMLETLERIKPQLAQLAGEDLETHATANIPAETPVLPEEVCRGCGHPLHPDEQFCGFCGARRTSGQALPSTWSSLWDLQRAAEGNAGLREGEDDASSLDVSPSEMEALVAELSGMPPEAPPLHPETPEPDFSLTPSSSSASTRPWDSAWDAPSAPAAPPRAATPPAIPPATPPAILPATRPAAPPPPAPLARTIATPAEKPPTPQMPEEYAPWKTNSSAEEEMPFPSFSSGRMPEGGGAGAFAETPKISSASPPANTLASPPFTTTEAQWTSAVKTRAWLDSVKEKHSGVAWLVHQWRAQRANIYLAAAATVLVVVLLGGGAPDSSTPVTAKAKPKAPPQPQLSLFDQALVNLGLAEPPPPPVEEGNPAVKVWVDVHTALYYCPGEELYGKTGGGRFTTQQEAEMEAFQPAARKPCN